MKLTELKKNINAEILNINLNNNLNNDLANRLLEIGFSPGANIKFIYEFNSTFAYKIRNSLIALRKEDAEKINIKIIIPGENKLAKI